ncbi:MAG: ATP-binding protein [Saprospiraceae bacterium]|nr:ATP-binding protein [Saprospiraceae bacterium]
MRIIAILWILIASQSAGQTSIVDSLHLPKDSFEVVLLDAKSIQDEIEYKISQHDYPSAVGSLLTAIEYFRQENNNEKVYYYRFVLARVYMYLGMFQKAANTLEYCHVYFKQEGRDLDVVRSQHALAYIYKKLGNMDMALYFLGQCQNSKADKFNEFCQNEHALVDAQLYLSRLRSQSILNNIYTYAKSINNTELHVKSLETLGDYYYHNARYKQAEAVYKKALELSKTNHFIDYNKQFSFRLYECSNYSGNYKRAADYLLQFIKYNDTLNKINSSEYLLKLIGKYEQKEIQSDKIDLAKSKRIFELKSRRSNYTLYSLLFSIGAILLAGFFIILFYQQKLETNQIIHNQTEQINNQKIKELENNLQLQSMQSMINGQESERERIAKDLHDSLGGVLSTIKLRFENLAHEHHFADRDSLEKLTKLIDTACDEVRYISNDLKPGSLEKLGLIEAIKDMLNRYKVDNGPEIFFQYYGFEGGGQIEANAALNIYRIIQELVNNSIKHAGCKEIFVQMHRKGNEMTISVEDDGAGFNESSIKKGMGLENIKSRVNYLRGELTLDSNENQGTAILVHLPIR